MVLGEYPGKYENSKISVRDIPEKGRGVFAEQDIGLGELIVSAPVLVFSRLEFYLIRILPCIMHTFAWKDPNSSDGDTAAIAFGLASLCNHSESFNAEAVRNYEDECLDLVAASAINRGNEILIRYETVPFKPV